MKTKSTKVSGRRKDANGWTPPYKGFPLCYHPPSGRLYKTIDHKRIYFGYLTDWKAAIKKYQEERDALYSGVAVRNVRDAGDDLTVGALCNCFLASKQRRVDSSELSPRTWQDYKATTDRLVAEFGASRRIVDLTADHFDRLRSVLAKAYGPVRLANEIQRVRTLMKFAFEDGLIEKPVRFGTSFKRPDKKVMRKHKNASGPRMLEAAELRKCLDAATTQMKAMILLAINGGLGQSDLSAMDVGALDIDGGWLDYPRVKTGIDRRIPLWPETVTALREWLPLRTAAKEATDKDAVFLTRCGQRWVKTNATGTPADALGQEFSKLLEDLGIKRPGVSFYAIRHSFRTVADAARDPVATDVIMGHADHTMGARYRERLDDSRLRAVADHVRAWLFAADTATDAE